MARRIRVLVLLAALASTAGTLAACGGEGVSVPVADTTVHHGAELFAERCSGCHTLDAAGTQGSATKVRDRERVDGPNFNQRKETVPNVLYAIRNGGFSGAIMPQNIVVGSDAQAVAQFLARYSGKDANTPRAPGNVPAPGGGLSSGG